MAENIYVYSVENPLFGVESADLMACYANTSTLKKYE